MLLLHSLAPLRACSDQTSAGQEVCPNITLPASVCCTLKTWQVELGTIPGSRRRRICGSLTPKKSGSPSSYSSQEQRDLRWMWFSTDSAEGRDDLTTQTNKPQDVNSSLEKSAAETTSSFASWNIKLEIPSSMDKRWWPVLGGCPNSCVPITLSISHYFAFKNKEGDAADTSFHPCWARGVSFHSWINSSVKNGKKKKKWKKGWMLITARIFISGLKWGWNNHTWLAVCSPRQKPSQECHRVCFHHLHLLPGS